MSNENPVTIKTIKTIATINILAGIWLFVSPCVYRAYTIPNAWNNWIVGAVIVIAAAIRFSDLSARGASVVNLILGAWTFVSPWVYGYTTDTGRFVNSLCVGVIVFVLGVVGSYQGMGRTHGAPPPLHT